MCSLTAASLIIGIGSTVFGAVGQMQAANDQADYQERQAQYEVDKSNYEQERARDNQKRILGEQRAGFLANGIAIDEGSANLALGETATETELDIAAIRYGGNVNADNLRQQASMTRSNGKTQAIGTVLGGIGGAINGLGQMGGSGATKNQIGRAYS